MATQSNTNRDANITQPTKGMNLDLHPINMDGTKSYYKAFNARQESIDGEQLALTNETSNEPCLKFKDGYFVMGKLVVPEEEKTFYFSTNNITSEIGMSDTSLLNPCNYQILLSVPADCLGFTSITPIHKLGYKLTNKTFEIYWTDGVTPPRWIDLYNIPLDGGNVDCNALKVFPDFRTPCIHIEETTDTGSLVTGAYQFFVAYSNSKGEELSQYYAATNPVGIWENQITNRLDFATSKAIKIIISNLDTSYEYFNIAVGKNINLTESFELVGTFDLESDQFQFLYTGNDKLARPLTTAEIFNRLSFYNKAETLVTQNNVLMLGGLEEEEIINYQPIVNKVKAYWEDWRVPENDFEGYSNGANTANLRGYMSDEGYALELAFVHASGRLSPGFHWPGPGVRLEDRELVDNADSGNVTDSPCEEGEYLEKWQVYNTATLLGISDGYTFAKDQKCYKGPYRYGDFASYESTLTYEDNESLWGELAGQKIRHWKFPDSTVRHIHDESDGTEGFEHAIFPLGIRIQLDTLIDAIKNSDLTEKQKNNIIGVKVLRANRAAHKSIIGKGLIYNVGIYTKDDQQYLYPNYPYNDLRKDPFISSVEIEPKSGNNIETQLDGFINKDISQTRYTLFSPDTSFVRPPVSGYLKLETAEYGKAKAHLIDVKDNAKYALSTKKGLKTALAIGLTSILGFEAGFAKATVYIKLENFLPTYNAMVDLLKKLIPYRQYGYQYTSVGRYSNFKVVPNEGNKIRRIATAKYLEPGVQAIENDIAPINNLQRESSVYIRVGDKLPFPHEVPGVPEDVSRFTKNSVLVGEDGISINTLRDYWNSLTPSQREVFALEEELTQFALIIYIYYADWDTMISRTNGAYDGVFQRDLIRRVSSYYSNEVLDNPPIKPTLPSRRVDISSYYASIKRNVVDQYGQIYSYATIDTGFCYYFDINATSVPIPDTIFGGDTFINRFGLKRKLPFFLTNTVGLPDDTDVFYDQLGNIGYPIYYLSTGPKKYTPSDELMRKLGTAYNKVVDSDFGSGLSAALTGGLTRFIPGMNALVQLVKEILERIGVKNNNLDSYEDKGFWEEGMMYLFAYGIPYFFVESDVNVDYRQAEDATDKNFYPNVGSDIPDEWLQEKNVSINKDNYYYYNKSLSKQNLENAFTHLPSDFVPERDAIVRRSTRVIYSQISNLDERQNNWLIFRANNNYDFPLTNGKLIDLNAIESEKVLARFENNSALYNAYITLDTNNKTAIAGNGSMFSQPPIEFSKTDIGYTGTQHKVFNSTKYGHFWIDAKRGNVFQMAGSGGLTDISLLGMKNWFKENLPFKIKQYFKNVNIDNIYTGIGLATCWDNKYDRYFITKKDYVPLDKNIIYEEATKTFKLNNQVIALTDKRYFCNASWTAAYSPLTESWVSYYGFIPDYYIEQQGYFQAGKNTNNLGLWTHHLRDDKQDYCRFFGEISPFEIYLVTDTDLESKVLQSIGYRNEVYDYHTNYERVLRKDISFTDAFIYNVDQSSGNIILELDNKQNMASGLFSKTNVDSVTASLAEANQIYKFNKFYDLSAHNNQPIVKFECDNTQETINPLAMDYNKNKQIVKARLKSDWFKLKLSNTKHFKFKFIFKWLIEKTIKSKR